MSVGYTIIAMSFAILCSVVWLVLGNSFWSALVMYLVSGQAAMLALIAGAALRIARTNKSS